MKLKKKDRKAGWRGFKVMFIGLVSALGALWLATIAADMMTARDTLSVAGGLLLFIGICAASYGVGIALARMWNRCYGVLLLAMLAIGGCARVEPGYEGIRVNMVGGERGVDAYPIVTGRVFFNPITYEIYQFPTFLQRVIWTAAETEGSRDDESFTFRSQEGYSFNIDVGFGYSFNPGMAPYLFERYRREAAEITDGPFRDIVREAFVSVGSQMEGLDILGQGVTTLNEEVTDMVREMLAEEATVEYVNMVGQPRVDDRVEASINAVIEATQRANEAEETVAQREFEAAQRIAQARGDSLSRVIEAAGRAEAIRIESEALAQFGSQILEMRSIEKWDGVMPQVIAGDTAPFISVPVR